MDKANGKDIAVFWTVTCVWVALAVWSLYLENVVYRPELMRLRIAILLWSALAVFAYIKIFKLRGFGILLPIVIAVLVVIYTAAFRFVEDLGYTEDFYAIVNIEAAAGTGEGTGSGVGVKPVMLGNG